MNREESVVEQGEAELAEQLLRVPPDVEWCEMHRRANRIGRPLQPLMFCKCCRLNYNKAELTFDQPTMSLSFLGAGVPLYFSLIGMSALLLLVSALAFTAPAFLLTVSSNTCSTFPCNAFQSYFSIQSYFNVVGPTITSNIIDYISLGCLVLQALLILWISTNLRQLQARCDEREVTASDFAVMIKMPTGFYSQREIQIMFDVWASGIKKLIPLDSDHNFPVAKIIPVERVGDLVELQTFILNTYEESKLLKAQGQVMESLALQKQYYQAKQLLQRKVAQAKFTRTSYCIVCFRYSQQKSLVLSLHQTNPISKLLKGDQTVKFLGDEVQISDLSEPSDINWLYYSKSEGSMDDVLNCLCSLLTSFAIAACNFGVILGSAYGASLLVPTLGDSVVMIVPSVVILLNGFSSFAVSKLAFMRTSQTRLDQWYSSAKLITLCIVLNTTASQLGAVVLTFGVSSIYNGQLALAMFFYFGAMMLAPFLPKLFNVELIRKALGRRKVLQPFSTASMNQREANSLFQGLEIAPDRDYAFVAASLINAGLWATFLPVSYFFTLLSLMINLGVEKYYFYNFYSDPKLIGSKLAFSSLTLLKLLPLTQALGYFICEILRLALYSTPYSNALLVDYIIVPLSGVAFGLIFLILPLSVSPFSLCLTQAQQQKLSYFQAQYRFTTTYEGQNPSSRSRQAVVMVPKSNAKKAVKYLRNRVEKYRLQDELQRQDETNYPLLTAPRRSVIEQRQVAFQVEMQRRESVRREEEAFEQAEEQIEAREQQAEEEALQGRRVGLPGMIRELGLKPSRGRQPAKNKYYAMLSREAGQ